MRLVRPQRFFKAKLLAVLEGRPIMPVGVVPRKKRNVTSEFLWPRTEAGKTWLRTMNFETTFLPNSTLHDQSPSLAENPELIPATAAAILLGLHRKSSE